MQIDFHHAATYICCRLGGLDHEDAAVVAHSSQYVDDATNDGPLDFNTGERYVRVTSAHRMLDIRLNGSLADNRMVWVPFHFLPGNDPLSTVVSQTPEFIRRMVCRPNSEIARQMVFDAVSNKSKAFGLHRFGVALHTFIDTWAHQGFVGMVNDFNKIDGFKIIADSAYKDSPVFADLESGAMLAKSYVANHLPVGHAGVVTLPDLPFLRWEFTRANGEVIKRDNPSDFLEAASHMYNMARRFATEDVQLPDVPIPPADLIVMDRLTRNTLFIDGEDRHKAWLGAIQRGEFSFGPIDLRYVESGPGSWKMAAVGADPDEEDGSESFEFTPEFVSSHWKRFHDAVQHQRLFVLHDLLPRHGLVAS